MKRLIIQLAVLQQINSFFFGGGLLLLKILFFLKYSPGAKLRQNGNGLYIIVIFAY